VRPSQTWPAIAARRAGVELLNLGVSGNCHLDQFVARAIRDKPASCISLKVGINIAGGATLTHRTFGPAVHGFLDTLRDGHPDAPILVVSPIICPMLEDSAGPIALDENGEATVSPEGPQGTGARSLRQMREILEEVVKVRSADDAHLHYLDGLTLFGESDLAELPDGVHPSPAGYVQIGERFADLVFGPDGSFAGVAAGLPVASA
jgi:hypothetical protein